MSDFSGETLSMNVDSNATMAEELQSIITSIVNKVDEIDTSIQNLVKGGLEGSAVETAAATYIKNRTALSSYLQTFAQLQAVLEQNAENTKNINATADSAAAGV